MYNILPETLGKPDVSPAADGSIVFEWLQDGPGKVWNAYWRLANGNTGKIRNQLFGGQTRTTLNDIVRFIGIE